MSIFEAIKQNDVSYVKKYLVEGGDVNARMNNTQTLLMRACMFKHVEIVKLLLQHPHIDITLDDGQPYHRTALYYAIEEDQEGNYQQIVDALYQPEKLSQRDRNLALIHYAGIGDQPKVKECLEKYSCDINYTEMDISTPLMQAAANGQLDMVKLLLTYPKIDINKVDDFNNTAFILAAKYGQMNVVDALLARKDIDLHIQSYLYSTALTTAIWRRHYEIAYKLLAKEIKFKDVEHPGAFLFAVKQDAVELVNLLLAKGADVNSKGGEEGCIKCPYWIEANIMQYDSPINSLAGPAFFDMPLNIAIQDEKIHVLPILLKYGADFDMPGAYGKTARKLLDGDFGKKVSNELKAIIRDFQCQTQQDAKDNNNAVYINVDKEGLLSNSSQLVAQNGLFKSNIEQKSSELSSVVNNNNLPSEKYLVINFANISEDKKIEILKFLSEKGIQTNFIDAEKIPEIPRYQVVK